MKALRPYDILCIELKSAMAQLKISDKSTISQLRSQLTPAFNESVEFKILKWKCLMSLKQSLNC